MSWLLRCAMLLALAGCATTPEEKPRDPVVVGQAVNVGVREQCHVVLPPEPEWQVDLTAIDAAELSQSEAVLAELEQHRQWAIKVKAAVLKCE